MPSRVGAMPHPSHHDQKKGVGRGGSGGKPRHQGITMQDLKKQTALRLMAQQQQEDLLLNGYGTQGSGPRPKASNTSGRAQPSPPTQAPLAQNRGASNGRRGNTTRKPNNGRRSYDPDVPRDDGSSSCASGGSSGHSGHTPRKGGGHSNAAPSHGNREQGKKLPHGLTVQELKELTAARLARESNGAPGDGSSASAAAAAAQRVNASRPRQQHQPQRPRVNSTGRLPVAAQRPPASPYHPTSPSPYGQVGSATPNRNESPVSLPTFQGHVPSFNAAHQNILHPVPHNRYEQSPNTLPAGHFHPVASPRMGESPSRPEEVFPLRSRHWSIDSVSTLGSEYVVADPKSPFPFRSNDGPSIGYPSAHMQHNMPSSGHMQDALGRALSRDRVMSQDRGSFDGQQPGVRHNKPSYEVLMSPNSAFSERSESRNQYLNSPFWAVDEERPSNGGYEASMFGNTCMPSLSENRGRQGNHGPGSASLNGLDGFRNPNVSAERQPYLETLSMPENVYGEREYLPIVPPPMPRQQSESAMIPNWVAESVLVTPQIENCRKSVQPEMEKKLSGAAAWPESANKAADIFRSFNDTSDDMPLSGIRSAATWTCSSPGSTSAIGVIGSRAPNNAHSFGGIDSLTEGLGTILNLKPQESHAASNALSPFILNNDDQMFASLGQSSSLEGHVSLSENEASLSNAHGDQSDFNATDSKRSPWWGGAKMFG